MKTEIGEYLVGAYLSQVAGCDFVDYNVRPASSGLEGLAEFDVVGLNFSSNLAYLCEVTTHLGGIHYGSNEVTLKKIQGKVDRQKWYAEKYLGNFEQVHCMFWAPYVPRGFLTEGLSRIDGLELIINGEYKKAVQDLQELARNTQKDLGNPFFRCLQVLENLRD